MRRIQNATLTPQKYSPVWQGQNTVDTLYVSERNTLTVEAVKTAAENKHIQKPCSKLQCPKTRFGIDKIHNNKSQKQ